MQIDSLVQIFAGAVYVLLGALIVMSYDVYKNRKLRKQMRRALKAELIQARDTLREDILSKAREGSPIVTLHFEEQFFAKLPLGTTFYTALSYQIHTSLRVGELVSIESTYNTIRHFNAVYFRKLLTDRGLHVRVHVQPTKELVQQIEETLTVLGSV